MKIANYEIVRDDGNANPLIIRDIGGDYVPSVTNSAEYVVSDLIRKGKLPEGRRLFYYDSYGVPGELVVKNQRFYNFGDLSLEEMRAYELQSKDTSFASQE